VFLSYFDVLLNRYYDVIFTEINISLFQLYFNNYTLATMIIIQNNILYYCSGQKYSLNTYIKLGHPRLR